MLAKNDAKYEAIPPPVYMLDIQRLWPNSPFIYINYFWNNETLHLCILLGFGWWEALTLHSESTLHSKTMLTIDWPHWLCAPLLFQQKALITSFYKLIRSQLIYSIVCFWTLFFACWFFWCWLFFRNCLVYTNGRSMSSCNDMEIKLMIKYFMMVCVLFVTFLRL